MKAVETVDAVRVEVVKNSVTRKAAWGRIRNAATGQVLHTGTPAYLKRVAKAKYNKIVSL